LIKKRRKRCDRKRKKKLDEETVTPHVKEEEAEEGFSIVRKKIPVTRPRVQQTDESAFNTEKEHPKLKNKGAYLDRNNKVPEGKRQFERHSGTGRGKEVSKGGAGGQHTWGTNPKNIAKEGFRQTDEEYNNDDSYFQSALNPRTRDTDKENKDHYSPERKWEKRTQYEPRNVSEQTPVEPETNVPAPEETKVEGEVVVPEGNQEWRKKKKGQAEEKKKNHLKDQKMPLL